MAGLIVDSFAGGGGASLGIEMALGRGPDYAINHDSEALACHAANHPETIHLSRNVWQVDPLDVVRNRPVALLWASPDCKHFSKAKGRRPVRRAVRDLAWVVVLWARRARPAVICLENVEEFRDWGPVGLDGIPCAERRGETFRRWVGELRRLGYRVEHRELRACDYGAPTIRKRLFLVARRDGLPIVWPEPSHGPGLLPYRTAAGCIDWSLPCPSIFERPRPLAEATLRRIARGVQRFVVEAAEPFLVPLTHSGPPRVHPIGEPLRTITTAHRGEFALVAPSLVSVAHGDSGGRREYGLQEPLGTITAGGRRHALVAAFLAQHNGGVTGHAADRPLSTLTVRGTQQQLVTSHLIKLRGTCRDGQPIEAPLPTVTAGGEHVGEVRAFLLKYYGTASGQAAAQPLHAVTTRDRFGLVTVASQDYAIADIGMRMLTPRELYRAQGFPDRYRIDVEHEGRPLTRTAQVRLCGNAVCPPVAAALVRANLAEAARPAEAVA